MKNWTNTRITAIFLLLVGLFLVLHSCTSSDPVDINNPANNVKPKKLGIYNLNQKWSTYKNTGAVQAQPNKAELKKQKLDKDLQALAKARKKYEASLKKKKEEAKKKKKKKKKVAKKKEKAPSQQTTEEMRKHKKQARNAAFNNDFSAGLLAGGAVANDEINPLNGEESPNAINWREIIFSNPSREKIEGFLAAYLQGQVDSNTFYAINDEMMASGNLVLQEAAISLLAMSPSSPSFQRLSKITSGRNIPNNLQVLARTSLNDVYKNLSYLSVLRTEVQNTNPNIALHAARLIRLSAEQNLGSNGRGNPNSAQFASLLAILNQVLQETESERLRHFVSNAYTYISQHIGRYTAGY